MKNIRIFLSENFPFLVVKCSIYLNRRVFVMNIPSSRYDLNNFERDHPWFSHGLHVYWKFEGIYCYPLLV